MIKNLFILIAGSTFNIFMFSQCASQKKNMQFINDTIILKPHETKHIAGITTAPAVILLQHYTK